MARQTFEIAAANNVLEELERHIAVAPAKAERTALRVLNRALKRGKSRTSKIVRDDLNLKKSVVDERIKTRLISKRALVGSLQLRDRRVALIEFMTKNQIATAWRRQNSRVRRSAGVAIKVHKNKGRELFPGTFVNIGIKSGRWHVLKRRYPERDTHEIQYGPNLARGFNKVLGQFASEAAEWMNAELLRLFRKNIDIT